MSVLPVCIGIGFWCASCKRCRLFIYICVKRIIGYWNLYPFLWLNHELPWLFDCVVSINPIMSEAQNKWQNRKCYSTAFRIQHLASGVEANFRYSFAYSHCWKSAHSIGMLIHFQCLLWIMNFYRDADDDEFDFLIFYTKLYDFFHLS